MASEEKAPTRVEARQGQGEVLCQCQRTEERTRLKEHAKGWHALVAMRLSHAVDVNAAGERLFEADQIP